MCVLTDSQICVCSCDCFRYSVQRHGIEKVISNSVADNETVQVCHGRSKLYCLHCEEWFEAWRISMEGICWKHD